jgi:hypothetical protein
LGSGKKIFDFLKTTSCGAAASKRFVLFVVVVSFGASVVPFGASVVLGEAPCDSSIRAKVNKKTPPKLSFFQPSAHRNFQQKTKATPILVHQRWLVGSFGVL